MVTTDRNSTVIEVDCCCRVAITTRDEDRQNSDILWLLTQRYPNMRHVWSQMSIIKSTRLYPCPSTCVMNLFLLHCEIILSTTRLSHMSPEPQASGVVAATS